jgi:hypothetical protein
MYGEEAIMAYFKIGNIDFSGMCNGLEVQTATRYNSQTNAAGNTVVDYINKKRTINVGIIPLNDTEMLKLQQAIAPFSVVISFRDPTTNALAENVACIIPDNAVKYYTIQKGKVSYNALSLTFSEL